MLLKCFNCTKCDKPFDCKEGMPKTPIAGTSVCAACKGDASNPLLCLMKFLDQPGFVKTDDGYICKGEIVVPNCTRCKAKQTSLTRPVFHNCGHVFCNACSKEGCLDCTEKVEKTYRFYHLIRFFDALIEKTLAEEIARPSNLTCAGCSISQPVERLFSCIDCATLICGVCQFHQHRQHKINPLLEIELTKLKTTTGQRYKEKLSGLQKKLKFLHKEVEKSMAKVIAVGTKRLKEVDGQETFVAAKKIATEVDVASDEFEQYCEQYIPVVRIFNENLTKLSEKVEGPAKD